MGDDGEAVECWRWQWPCKERRVSEVCTQNEDGGWGGNKGVKSKVTYTSRALAALSHFPNQYEDAITRGWEYLYQRFKAGTLYDREPIGLYFSRLWYSEELYNILFLLNALKGMTE